MSAPDFNQKTIDTLAKRASYKCSNPDCRVSTIGPNTDPYKSTLIGEAAHIHGARAQSKRYLHEMADIARGEITNGIWLCRNCHKLIDTDEARYTSDLLFTWREEHEKFVLSELGSNTDKIKSEQQRILLSPFKEYPHIIHRILLDIPDGWEWRLTAELMRYFNTPYFKKLKDLRGGYYIKPKVYVADANVLNWLREKIKESSDMVIPIEKLLRRLTLSFGNSGEPGDINEIHHVCTLIRDYIKQVIEYEESLYFCSVPDKAGTAVSLLKHCMGSQIEKLEAIPKALDKAVSMINTEHEGTTENPKIIRETITFEFPSGCENKIKREIKRLGGNYSDDESYGCFSIIASILFIIFLVKIVF